MQTSLTVGDSIGEIVKLLALGPACVAIGAWVLAGCSWSPDTDDQGAVSDSSSQIGFQEYTPESTDQYAEGKNALSIITTRYPDITQICNGHMGVNPLVVVNNTSETQWFNATDNTDLANNIMFYDLSKGVDGSGCANGSEVLNGTAFSVAPGATIATGMAAGGHSGPDTALSGQGHNLSIGGGKSGNDQWYDLWLKLSATASFKHWELGYDNTGGTNSSQNTQAGLFNVVKCTATQDGSGSATINVTDTIVTTYGKNQKAWEYTNNDPICFAFFDPSS